MFFTILENIFCVLMLVLLFGMTIFIHELGHFLTALWCGMTVDVFSIGFGKAIWKKKHKGVLYKIGCIPFGGYVALPQLDPTGMEVVQGSEKKPEEEKEEADGDEVGIGAGEKKKEEDTPPPRALPPISPWKKILVSAMGSVGNVLFAIFLAWVVFLSPAPSGGSSTVVGFVDTNAPAFNMGIREGDRIVAVNDESVSTWYEFITECILLSGDSKQVTLSVMSGDVSKEITVPTVETETGLKHVEGISEVQPPCIIGQVAKGSSADKGGMKPADIVKSYNGEDVENWESFVNFVQNSSEKECDLVVDRSGKMVSLKVTPSYDDKYKIVRIGVTRADTAMMWMQFKKPMAQISHDAKGIWRILRALTSRREGEAKSAVNSLGGPPAIFFMLWIAIKMSLLNAVGFIRFLNINLAILNMLPIPILDGGHIVFSLWEGITRRKIHPKVVNALVNLFGIPLIGFILFISARDLIVKLPQMIGLSRGAGQDVEQTTNNPAITTNSVSVEPSTADAPMKIRKGGGCVAPDVGADK